MTRRDSSRKRLRACPTKVSHDVKSGERFAGCACRQPGGPRVRQLAARALLQSDATRVDRSMNHLHSALQAASPA